MQKTYKLFDMRDGYASIKNILGLAIQVYIILTTNGDVH